jgi:hypothetical protein
MAGVEKLTGPLAEALASHRQELNARFVARRQMGQSLDAADFLDHLQTTVDPIVRAVAGVLPEKVDAVVEALYDLSLELFAAKWLGREVKNPAVRAAWQNLLPAAPTLLAREPGRLAGSVSNAVIQLAATPGARTAEWLTRLAALAPRCASTTEFLQCGQVLAWQAGLPQYRAGALAIAGRLDARLASAALGLPADLAVEQLGSVIERLRDDPWLTPPDAVAPVRSSPRIRIVRQAGGFRGFGGPFMRPPQATQLGRELVVSDRDGCWRLIADAFGAVFLRVAARELASSANKTFVDAGGCVRWAGETEMFTELAGATSSAGDSRTLAVTLATSHQVFILAKA